MDWLVVLLRLLRRIIGSFTQQQTRVYNASRGQSDDEEENGDPDSPHSVGECIEDGTLIGEQGLGREQQVSMRIAGIRTVD